MNDTQASLKNTSKTALVAMVALFILSIIYYKERVLFADASFITFHIINDKSLLLQRLRLGSFISHIFPYICQKLHLPLRVILLCYGSSFYLIFMAVIAILVYLLKQYKLAILMSLYYLLFASESFIWVDELQQGMAWMFLSFGLAKYLGDKKANSLIVILSFICLVVITLFTHFVIIIPFAFLWIYFILEKANWPFSRNFSILLTAIVICIIIAKFTIHIDQNEAESAGLHDLTHFSIKDVVKSFSAPVVQIFFYRCLVNYWAGVVVFIIGIVTLIKRRRFLLAMWTCVSVVGYIIVMGLTFGHNNYDPRLFHIESEWSAIGILVAAPFVFEFLPLAKTKNASLLLGSIILVRLVYIVSFTTLHIPPSTQ